MTPIFLTDTVTPDLERGLHYAMLWGMEGVALRMMGHERLPNTNEAKLRYHIEQTEMPMMAFSPGLFEGDVLENVLWMEDLMRLEDALHFAEKFDRPIMMTSGFARPERPEDRPKCLDRAVDVLRKAGDRAAKRQITLAVQNEIEGLCPTGAALAELLTAVNHPNIRAGWSPYDAFMAGELPEEGAYAIAPHAALVLARDGLFQKNKWQETVIGEGHLGWPAQIRILKAGGFSGFVCLEMYLAPKGKMGLRTSTVLIHLLQQTR